MPAHDGLCTPASNNYTYLWIPKQKMPSPELTYPQSKVYFVVSRTKCCLVGVSFCLLLRHPTTFWHGLIKHIYDTHETHTGYVYLNRLMTRGFSSVWLCSVTRLGQAKPLYSHPPCPMTTYNNFNPAAPVELRIN